MFTAKLFFTGFLEKGGRFGSLYLDYDEFGSLAWMVIKNGKMQSLRYYCRDLPRVSIDLILLKNIKNA